MRTWPAVYLCDCSNFFRCVLCFMFEVRAQLKCKKKKSYCQGWPPTGGRQCGLLVITGGRIPRAWGAWAMIINHFLRNLLFRPQQLTCLHVNLRGAGNARNTTGGKNWHHQYIITSVDLFLRAFASWDSILALDPNVAHSFAGFPMFCPSLHSLH